MARIEKDDFGEFLFASFIFLVASCFIIALGISIASELKSTEENRKIASKSDAVILLHQGNNTSVYYTNKNTIKLSNDNRCVEFIENKTNKPVSACTQFTIKAN